MLFNLYELENRKCPICDTESNNKLLYSLLGNNVFFQSEKFDLSHCSSCDLLYLSTIPKKNELFKIYTKNEQFSNETYQGEHAKVALHFYTDRLNQIIQKQLLDKENLHTLEIGGGMSWISNVIKNFSQKNITVVQDITTECVKACTWVDKYIVDELENALPSLEEYGPYQIISMTHVFEHLIFPLDILNICHKLLDDQGVIFITAPHRPKGWTLYEPVELWEKWAYNHVPAHINYYNNTSMSKAASKTGLQLVYFDANHEEGQAFEAWLSK